MARPFYPHEAEDPDLDWLVSNFLYDRSDYIPIECSGLPLLLLPYREVRAESRPEVDEEIQQIVGKRVHS